jgi:hypothetical protein
MPRESVRSNAQLAVQNVTASARVLSELISSGCTMDALQQQLPSVLKLKSTLQLFTHQDDNVVLCKLLLHYGPVNYYSTVQLILPCSMEQVQSHALHYMTAYITLP